MTHSSTSHNTVVDTQSSYDRERAAMTHSSTSHNTVVDTQSSYDTEQL